MQNSKFSAQSKELSQQSSCASSESYRPCCVHVDNRGITDGLCGGEMKCMGPRAKDADLWNLI